MTSIGFVYEILDSYVKCSVWPFVQLFIESIINQEVLQCYVNVIKIKAKNSFCSMLLHVPTMYFKNQNGLIVVIAIN